MNPTFEEITQRLGESIETPVIMFTKDDYEGRHIQTFDSVQDAMERIGWLEGPTADDDVRPASGKARSGSRYVGVCFQEQDDDLKKGIVFHMHEVHVVGLDDGSVQVMSQDATGYDDAPGFDEERATYEMLGVEEGARPFFQRLDDIVHEHDRDMTRHASTPGETRQRTAERLATLFDGLDVKGTPKDAEDAVSWARDPKRCPYVHKLDQSVIDEVFKDVHDKTLKTNAKRAERWRAAYDPHTPPETLDELARDGGQGMRARVARNPSASPETLRRLAEDEDEVVRRATAENVGTPQEALAILATDKAEYVRDAVAQNVSTSPETLSELAKSESRNIRYAVARNANASPETLSELTRDEDHGIRGAACRNENTPTEAIVRVAKTEEDMWARTAAMQALRKRATTKTKPSPMASVQAAAAKVRQNEESQGIEQSGPTSPNA